MRPFWRDLRLVYAWVLVALTDLAVSVPWILLFYRAVYQEDWYRNVPGVWLPLLVYGAASLWEAGDRGPDETAGRRRTLAMAGGLVLSYLLAYWLLPPDAHTGLLTGNPALAFVLPAAYLWWQGARAISDGMDYSRLFDRYGWQLAAAALGVVLLIQFGGARDPSVQVLLYWSVVLLLGAGLTALVVARERALRAGQARMGEKGSGSERTSPLLTGMVGGLVALTLGASYVLSVDRLRTGAGAVWHVLRLVLDGIISTVYLILYRWVLLFGPPVERVVKMLAELARRKQAQDPAMSEDGAGKDYIPPYANPLQNPTFARYFRIALLVGLLVVLAVVVYRLNRRRRKPAADGEEEIVNLGFWSNLWADLKSLVTPRPAAATGAAAVAEEALNPRDPRMLFRRLQAWGREAGRPRQRWETPNAYGNALAGINPGEQPGISAVAGVYNQARYGAAPPAPDEVEAAAAAVDRLETERL